MTDEKMISPLERLINPDYKKLFVDYFIEGGSKRDYLILCSECNQWVGAHKFKFHLRREHNFEWWDSVGVNLDGLKDFIVHIRPKGSFERSE